MNVSEKVIIVTGGGKGLGRALVLNLLTEGCRVVAVDINGEALAETFQMAKGYARSLMISQTDITNPEAIDDMICQTLFRYGAIDGIINNAGIIQPFRRIRDLDTKDIDRVFNINFKGTLNLIKAALPALHKRPEAHIVNISSMGGFLPVPGQAIYGASKAAVKILSEALRAELQESAIGVTTVFPGALYTNIKANSGLQADAGAGTEGHAPSAAFSPTKAAKMIIHAIEQNKAQLYIGKDAESMNLLYRLNPNMATKLISNKIAHNLEQPIAEMVP